VEVFVVIIIILLIKLLTITLLTDELTGIFRLEGRLSPSSSIRNSIFKKIKSTNNNAMGGVMSLYIPNSYSLFTIDKCIFSNCNASSGGAIRIASGTGTFSSAYIHITRTRFEDNSAINGSDISAPLSYCFNKMRPGTLSSSTCSSSTPEDERLYCNDNFDNTQLQNNCSTDIVYIYLFIFFFFLNN
jgi:hypothetical protein